MTRVPSGCGLALLLVLLCMARAAPARSAPADPGERPFTPLRMAREPELQAALDRLIDARGLRALVGKRKLAITLVGVTDPSCPRMAGVNGDAMMYAASMPKIAILLGAFKRIERGELTLDAELEGLMTRMIRNSSNPAATEVMDRVGREFIAEVLQSPEYKLYDPEFGGGLWVGRAYAKRAAWRRDPLHNLSHGATTIQVARFYYLLDAGRLVRPDLAERMREILSQPGVNHKFVKGILGSFPGASMLRKSGTWRDYHADSAIIEHAGKRYIAVAMVEDPKGGEILEKLVLGLDGLIFEVPAHCPDAVAASTP